MSGQSSRCAELNNKLLNVVIDGQMEYIKDSGMEKTLIAGESAFVRLLYDSNSTRVQTNALFVEGLNKEPKSRDKSSALQKRLVRYWFPHKFPRDIKFERHMRSPKMLGAFLSLLLDHYVKEDEIVDKLQPSVKGIELQIDQMWLNSPVMQYLSYISTVNPTDLDLLIGAQLDVHVSTFMSWRINENFSEFSSADTVNLFRECFDIEWKTVREGGRPVNKKIIKSLKPETQILIDRIKKGDIPDGTEDAEGPLVEDG
jgi:hypothetical protein